MDKIPKINKRSPVLKGLQTGMDLEGGGRGWHPPPKVCPK